MLRSAAVRARPAPAAVRALPARPALPVRQRGVAPARGGRSRSEGQPMSHQVYAFEPPERFVAGTVGEPGERTFFLQARGGGRLVSVVLEKVQVSLLAEKLDELLAEAHKRFGVVLPEAGGSDDNEPL